MKYYRIIAAALCAGALFASCNKTAITDTDAPEVPSVREYTISIDATKGFDTKALALSADGKTLAATWEDGDAVAVCRIQSDPAQPLSQIVGKLTPETFGSASTKLTGTLNLEGISEGDWLFLQYPYKQVVDSEGGIWLSSSYDRQDGTLETISSFFDFATCGVQVTAVDTEHLSASAASFVNRQAVVRFSLKDASSAPIAATKLAVTGGVAQSFWHDNYYDGTVIATASAPVNEFTMALHTTSASAHTLYAAGTDNVYSAVSPAVSFTDGTFNRGGVKMSPLSYAGFDTDSDWTVIGALSEYGMNWDNDLNMWTNGAGLHVAAGVKIASGDSFKLRKGRDWAENLGYGDLSAVDFCVSYQDGPNMSVNAGGVYDIYLDSATGLLAIVPASGAGKESKPIDVAPAVTGWNVIGIDNDWDNDILATENPAGVWTAVVTTTASSDFKWRKDGAWDETYGGTLHNLGEPFAAEQPGDNVTIPAAGKYEIKLDLTATPPTITVTELKPVWSLIGDFTGWGSDVDMVLTGGKWVSPATHMSGQFKLRFDHAWDINLGADGTAPFAVTLGVPFAVVSGGQNIVLPGEDDYIVTYDPAAQTVLVEKAASTVTLTVGVISYLVDELGASGYQVRWWDGSTSGDVDLVATGASASKSVGTDYWSGAEQSFTMFSAEVPAGKNGYKIHNGDRWFGGDGTFDKPSAYIFNYDGDKALYE